MEIDEVEEEDGVKVVMMALANELANFRARTQGNEALQAMRREKQDAT